MSSTPNSDIDLSIAAAIGQSPERAFKLLVDSYSEPLYWHIRRIVVSHHDAEDALQETLLRIYRSLADLRQTETLRGWIYRIATNEALRLRDRLTRNGHTLSLDDPDTTGHHDAMADEYVDYSNLEAVRLQNAILSLPPKQQVTFNLRYYDNMDYEEIAQITQSSAASAKANYHHAKDRIIKYMQSND